MITIEPMTPAHAAAVYDMMQTFYASPAVHTNGSDAIFRSDIEACVSGNPYLEGFVFAQSGEVVGYAMIAKSFSTEFGRPCIWIEDLYLGPEHRGQGVGSRFFTLLEERYPGTILRLEVEEENHRAVRTYRKNGFDILPYMEMKKLL